MITITDIEPNTEYRLGLNIKNGVTFRFNSKCSPLKLLCTIVRLCEGTPLSTTLAKPSLASPLNPLNCHFLQAWQQNKEKVTAPISALCYPTRSPPRHCNPTHLPIITGQVKHRVILRRRTPPEDVPIDLISIDLTSIVVIFFIAAHPPSVPTHPLPEC